MAWGLIAAAAPSLLGSYGEYRAADKASKAQVEAAQLGVDEQRRQFDALQAALAPYAAGGEAALAAQQELVGLAGPEAQQAAIAGVQGGPQYEALVSTGENAILQNAAATGGLRGGNTQGLLAQYRPQVLSDLINQRYAQYGGLSAQGQNAATMTGTAGLQTAGNVANLFAQQGAAQAGGALAKGQVGNNLVNNAAQTIGFLRGLEGGF